MKKTTLPGLREISVRQQAKRMIASLGEGWYYKEDRQSQDRGRLLICTYNANVIANLIGGSFWTGLLLLMNADDSFIGYMTMIGVAANMLQMFAPLMLEQFKKRKMLIMVLRSVLFLINILFIGLIPAFPVAQQAKLTLTAVAILAVNVLNAVIAPAVSVWHLQSIPRRVRTSFYSLITMTNGAVVAICNLLGSKVVDAFKYSGNEFMGLLILRLVALGLAVYDMYLYWHIEEYQYESSDKRFSIRELFTLPLREKLYMKTVAVSFLWNFSANIPGSYYTVYLLKNLNVDYSYLMLVSFLNVPIVLLLTPLWKRVLQKCDWFKTLYVAMALYQVYYIGLAFVTGSSLWLYTVSAVICYVMGIGINLSFTGIPYLNIPEKNQTVFIGFYSTMANFAALLGVSLGKYFIEWTESFRLNLFGVEMINKQYIVLLTAIVMVGAVVAIWRIDQSMPRE